MHENQEKNVEAIKNGTEKLRKRACSAQKKQVHIAFRALRPKFLVEFGSLNGLVICVWHSSTQDPISKFVALPPQKLGTTSKLSRTRNSQASNLCHGTAIHAKFIKGSLPHFLFTLNHILNSNAQCRVLSTLTNGSMKCPTGTFVPWSTMCALSRVGMVKPSEFYSRCFMFIES